MHRNRVDVEVQRSGGALQAVRTSRAGDLARVGTCRRHKGMERWGSSILLEFLAFVPQGSGGRNACGLRHLSLARTTLRGTH